MRPALPCALQRARRRDRRGPDHPERDTVLAAVKDATRRRWRWPAAILDGGCATSSATTGRDEETASGPNSLEARKKNSRSGSSDLDCTPFRAGASTASKPAAVPLAPKPDNDVHYQNRTAAYRQPRRGLQQYTRERPPDPWSQGFWPGSSSLANSGNGSRCRDHKAGFRKSSIRATLARALRDSSPVFERENSMIE